MPAADGTLAAFALLAWAAFAVSRFFATRKIPELVAFLVVGIVAGPAGFEIVDRVALRELQPVTEVALGVLMFGIGERISPRVLRASRWPFAVGVLQYAVAGVAVFVALKLAGVDEAVALLLATLAGAGAPMTISAVVSSTRASGPYAEGLVATHAVNDALATLAFAAVLPVARLLTVAGEGTDEAVLRFLRLGLGGAVLGVARGWVVARVGARIETSGELLLFLGVQLLAAWAIADALRLSLPLAALVAGATSESLLPRDLSARQFRVLRSVEQPLYLIFFALAGAGIHLDALAELGIAGIVYVTVRSVAKVASGVVGGAIARLGARRSLQLGVDSLPQAGVAVGLAVLAGERLPDAGGDVAAVILGSVVLFELVGPLLVARGLRAQPADEAPALADDTVPGDVLLALQGTTDVPAWLLELCARWRSTLVVVGPFESDDGDAVINGASAADVEVVVRPYAGGDWVGEVIRTARSAGSDLVVLRGVDGDGPQTFALRTHEILSRQLGCPVIPLPGAPRLEAADAGGPRRRWRRARR